MSAPDIEPRRMSDPVVAARLAIQTLGARYGMPEIERLCADNPDDPDLRPLLALAALSMGDVERAQAEVRSLLASSPGPGAYGVAAELATFLNDLRRRDEMLTRGQALDADHFLVLRAAAERAMMEGDFAAASAALTRSLALYPRDCETLRVLLSVYGEQNDSEAASRVLDDPPDWFAGTPHFHRSRAARAIANGDFEEAEAEARLAVAASRGRDAQAWAGLALAQLRLGKLDECEQSARHALDLNGRLPAAHDVLLMLALDRGDFKAAETNMRQAARAVPALKGRLALSRAAQALGRGKTRAAMAALLEAERIGPYRIARRARLAIIEMHLSAGRRDAAWRKLDEAIAAEGLTDTLRCVRMEMLEKDGRHAEAEADLRALTERERPFPDAIAPAIGMWKARQRDDRVAALADYALKRLPGVAGDLVAIVQALDEAELKDEARRLFEAARRRYPSDCRMRLLALILASNDRRFGHALYELSNLPEEVRRRVTGPMPTLWLRVRIWALLKRWRSRRKSGS